jgi:serine/threonine-protein kinase
MSKPKDTPPAGPDAYPSAAVLKALAEVKGKRLSKERRAREAWPLIVQAAANCDFPVIADFALENELVAALVDDRGPRVASWANPVDGSEMIWIPPGPFVVGKENDPASCQGFSLARHPVTNAQFARFLRETSYVPPPPDQDRFVHYWIPVRIRELREDHPAVWVSLVDALYYCRWAGLALPTEWLWEKAARGPEGRRFPWGQEGPIQYKVKLANVKSDDTCAVGSFARTRSAYGCEDLIGNVSEWCQPIDKGDYGRFPPAWPEVPEPQMPPGPYAPVRGSCFLRTRTPGMAAWHRRRLSITRRNQWTGFRPACLLPFRPAT